MSTQKNVETNTVDAISAQLLAEYQHISLCKFQKKYRSWLFEHKNKKLVVNCRVQLTDLSPLGENFLCGLWAITSYLLVIVLWLLWKELLCATCPEGNVWQEIGEGIRDR